MATCNLFRQLTKETGNFLMFGQYSDDMTKYFVQHENYGIMPSKFIALDINYYSLLERFKQDTDLNKAIPTYLQNYYENGCAYMKSTNISGDIALDQPSWAPENWTPKTSANIFWNSLLRGGLVDVAPYDDGWAVKQTGANESFNVIPQVKYIGNIDIQSFDEKEGIGFSEVYCYIPNAAKETFYKVTTLGSSMAFTYNKPYAVGCDATTEDIIGTLPTKLKTDDAPSYLYQQQYDFAAYVMDSGNIPHDGEANIRDANKYREMCGSPVLNNFSFNTIVVLYDIVRRDANGNVTVVHSGIPMGMYLTGTVINDGVQRGMVNNTVTKFTEVSDAYDMGTSYGLRICTKFVVTPNATTISSVSVDSADQYAGFSKAMDAMSQSQEKMNEVLEKVASNDMTMKEYLAAFRNGRTNVPYIVNLGTEATPKYIWFVNGRNTKIPANGNPGKDGKDGTILSLIEYNGTYYWSVDGQNTGVRAEGKDGLPGAPGARGGKGDKGDATIVEIKLSGTDAKLHWFIDGTDTGHIAQVDQFDLKAVKDDVHWYKNGKDTGVVANGKNGSTPTIKEVNGIRYWFIEGRNTGIRAEGVNGRSFWATSSQPYISNDIIYFSASGLQWTTGDIVLYLGSSYGLAHIYDIYRVGGYDISLGRWAVSKIANISGNMSDNVSGVNVKANGKNLNISVTENNNTTTTYISSDPHARQVQFTTDHKRFINTTDTAYYTGNPGRAGRCYVEIPYGRKYVKNGSMYDLYLTVGDEYVGWNGAVLVKKTHISVPIKTSTNVKVNRFGFSTYRQLDVNGEVTARANVLHDVHVAEYGRKNASDPTTLNGISVGPGVKIVKELRLWQGLTRAEITAINNSYMISGKVGRVHIYVDLRDLVNKLYADNTAHRKYKSKDAWYSKDANNFRKTGIMKFDGGKWVVIPTEYPVATNKPYGVAHGHSFEPLSENRKPAKSFIDFLATYRAEDMWMKVHTRNKQDNGLGSLFIPSRNTHTSSTGIKRYSGSARKFRWVRNKRRKPIPQTIVYTRPGHSGQGSIPMSIRVKKHLKWIPESTVAVNDNINVNAYRLSVKRHRGPKFNGDNKNISAFIAKPSINMTESKVVHLLAAQYLAWMNLLYSRKIQRLYKRSSSANRSVDQHKNRHILVAATKNGINYDVYNIKLRWLTNGIRYADDIDEADNTTTNVLYPTYIPTSVIENVGYWKSFVPGSIAKDRINIVNPEDMPHFCNVKFGTVEVTNGSDTKTLSCRVMPDVQTIPVSADPEGEVSSIESYSYPYLTCEYLYSFVGRKNMSNY